MTVLLSESDESCIFSLCDKTVVVYQIAIIFDSQLVLLLNDSPVCHLQKTGWEITQDV